MTIHKIEVDLGERSYSIMISPKGLTSLPEEFRGIFAAKKQIVVVTNETVGPILLGNLKDSILAVNPSCSLVEITLPDGEKFKNVTTLNRVFDQLLQSGVNRRCLMVALGGGVIGDMCGFAAATYQRGVDFFQVPTTLLSQVDSSVGGKTGVNHPLGKNMIGAFYQPVGVLIDTDALSTLPGRELSAGIAEVIKYGLIADYDFFCWLEKFMPEIMAKDGDALAYAIKRSCEIKADVVASDEKEAGIRAILNLGHTYGHAIESHTGYGNWLHGEAVAVGMKMAAELSRDLGWIGDELLNRLVALLQSANLPTDPPKGMTGDNFKRYMSVDKKVVDGKLRLVLLEGYGKAVVTDNFDLTAFNNQLSHLS